MGDEPTASNPAESEDSKEGSFVRWQGITLKQMGYAVNLILTFATASLGFGLSLIKDKDFTPGCWGKAFMAFSLCLLFFSLFLGIWCVINRLLSFRHTKNAASIREKRHEMRKRSGTPEGVAVLERQLEMERAHYATLDDRTWSLFWFQIATFSAGILFLIASFAAVYRAKVF